MADWDEIRRLAADLQRAQLTSTVNKLSERNCVEIIQKLIANGQIEVIYSTDGREYLTPQQLEREIRDELFVHGGRINLVDLQQIINVDYSHIDNKVTELIKSDRTLTIIQGELIDRDYLDRIAEEINEMLQESGQVSIMDLGKTFALPSDFLLSVVEDRLGILIHGQLDTVERGVIFTDAFVARQTSCMRGAFTAITKPTSLSSLLAQYGFQEKLFNTFLSQLISEGKLEGSVQGRQDKAVFVPEVYTKTQAAWVDNFFKQNGYIGFDTLVKVGITDSKNYLKRRYKGETVLFLQTCCAGKTVCDNVDAAIDEAMSSQSWVDIMPILPSPFTLDDAEQMLQHCLKGQSRSSAHVFCESIVVSDVFLGKCKEPFQDLMKAKAEKDAVSSPVLTDVSKKEVQEGLGGGGGRGKQEKKEERQKKATAGSGQKGGGGRGGRETKTKKKDKSKNREPVQVDDDESTNQSSRNQELEFMTEDEICEILTKENPDFPEELLTEMSQHLFRPLTRQYQEIARSIFLASGEAKRKSHVEFQEKITGLWTNAKLFEKGIQQFSEELQVHLSKHLLKTVCTNIMNLTVNSLASEHMLGVADPNSLTPESRAKIITKLPEKLKSPLNKLNVAINGKVAAEFLEQYEEVASDLCEIMFKKIDKRTERQIFVEHRMSLQEQLNQEQEPAMALHLAAVLLFQHYSHCLIHAPGRCVPQIITFLSEHLSNEDYEKLVGFQTLVMKQLSGKSEDKEEEEETGNVGRDLHERLPEIKKMALEVNKRKEEK